MARFSEIDELVERKRALIAESEVYRQTLKIECQNLGLYGVALRRKFLVVGAVPPLVLAAVFPFLLNRFVKRPTAAAARPGLLAMAFTAWRVYQKLAPVLQPLVSQILQKRRQGAGNGPAKRH